jgi:hypothetical protein
VFNRAFLLSVTKGDQLYFDYSAYDPDLHDKFANTTVVVSYSAPRMSISVPTGFHSTDQSDSQERLFPLAYRGWSYAGYNGNSPRATAPIDESLLVFDEDRYPDRDKVKDDC